MAKSSKSRAKQHRPPEPQHSRVVEGYGEVSTHPMDEMLRKWGRGELSPEQAIGHLMQHLAMVQDQLERLRGRVATRE